uniref:Uncharacterized protein n=1 Tax=Anopheles melas TaxID=34690 RepID=A0A182UH66_9DIPT
MSFVNGWEESMFTSIPSRTFASEKGNLHSDVLREKQNHIEQLMQEREIDREETANQSIMYQKNIQQRDTTDGGEVGRWAELVRRRALRIADLRREFQGWHGNHERHCILHDVLLA